MSDLRGKKIVQGTLDIDQQGMVAGLRNSSKVLQTLLITLLILISGLLSGILSELIVSSILVPDADSAVIFICMGLAVVILMIGGVLTHFIRGVQISVIITFIVVMGLWALGVPEGEGIGFLLVTMMLSLLGISLISLSILSLCLSIFLIFACGFQPLKWLIYLAGFINLTAATFASRLAFWGDINTQIFITRREQSTLPDNLIIVICISSLIVALIIFILSRIKTKFYNRHDSDLSFLWVFAISIASWGGTSLYALDLSYFNFRNAKLGNTDFRLCKLYRTCFQGVDGLDRARVDGSYLDLDKPKVQKLLTRAFSNEKNFTYANLRGAYLQDADLQELVLVDANLNGACLRDADMRGAILVRTQLIGADISGVNLTGACIENWSINSKTCFKGIQCDYVYRQLNAHGEMCDRYPIDRNFESGEFASLYQEMENVVELIFKEGNAWQAALFSLKKLRLEDEELNLELKGIEKRGDLWVVKVTHNKKFPKHEVEYKLNAAYEEMKCQLAAKEETVNKLLGIVSDQATALKGYSQQPFGNNFFIAGSTITNLSGSGKIEYGEAAHPVRSLFSGISTPEEMMQTTQHLLGTIQRQKIALTAESQVELIQQILLSEADSDPIFKHALIDQGSHVVETLPEGPLGNAIRTVIAQLS